MKRDAGVALLEILIAVVILALSGMVVLGALGDATSRLRQARLESKAGHLIASAGALLEAGLATPETLDGPAPDGVPAVLAESDESRIERSVSETAWRLELDSEPTAFPNVTQVTITALHLDRAIATRAQLVTGDAP
ncbi:MAG: type II secretion system protein [Planctomycetota bacterium]